MLHREDCDCDICYILAERLEAEAREKKQADEARDLALETRIRDLEDRNQQLQDRVRGLEETVKEIQLDSRIAAQGSERDFMNLWSAHSELCSRVDSFTRQEP